MARKRIFVSWSSGKDSAFTLCRLLDDPDWEVAGLLITVAETDGAVAMHGTAAELLDAQIAATGLPAIRVPLPWPCPNGVYEARLAEACDEIRSRGVGHIALGDLFLADIRAYREEQMKAAGMLPVFPLWKDDTAALARAMIGSGLVTRLATVDLAKLDESFAGRTFDEALLADLPVGIDPCGENGEFHTFVSDCRAFSAPVPVRAGKLALANGFAYANLELA